MAMIENILKRNEVNINDLQDKLQSLASSEISRSIAEYETKQNELIDGVIKNQAALNDKMLKYYTSMHDKHRVISEKLFMLQLIIGVITIVCISLLTK